jgi:putative DNA primase/helicase
MQRKICPTAASFPVYEQPLHRNGKGNGNGTHARAAETRAPEPTVQPSPSPEQPQEKDQDDAPENAEFLWNDSGNGDRLIAAHGDDLIYGQEKKGFLAWTGKNWADDDVVLTERLAEQTMLAAHKEATHITDSDRRRAFLRFLNQSLQRSGIANMVHSAKRKAVMASISEFDTDPYLLNCKNGTLDLRTGELREHRRADRITKLIPHAYDPKAECPTFMGFVSRIMGAHPDATEADLERADRLVGYLQLAFGCAATGKPEKVIFMLHGQNGNNGKTTLLEIIREALGDHEYGGQVQIETLMAKPKESAASNSINADIADLRGKTFVSSSEVERGHRLALARVKYLTGLTQLRGRHLNQNFFNFKPTHKLFLDCNDKPVITDPNDAVWNRVKLIPFTVTIPNDEIDTDLPVKLRQELPGILRWIVEGAKRYIAGGLKDVPEVRAATEEYREESDKLGEFLEDRCVIDLTTRNSRGKVEAWAPIGELWSAYQVWAESTGEQYPLSKTMFDERIQRLGCIKGVDSSGSKRCWFGIRFKV